MATTAVRWWIGSVVPFAASTPVPTAPVITNGDDPGSDTVKGTGPPNLGPDCLRVYEVGPNGRPDNGGPDDEFLGQGGTDGGGNFSIMLNRPLKDGDVIYILDRCPPFDDNDPLIGPLAPVFGPAPAPTLSWLLTAAALVMLAGIAWLRLRRASA